MLLYNGILRKKKKYIKQNWKTIKFYEFFTIQYIYEKEK